MSNLIVWDIDFGRVINGEWQSGCIARPPFKTVVNVKLSFLNNSRKIIKYATFYFTPYNRVGDSVEYQMKMLFTGPLESEYYMENFSTMEEWNNDTISSIVLDKVEVEYMDGTQETLNNKDIDFYCPIKEDNQEISDQNFIGKFFSWIKNL